MIQSSNLSLVVRLADCCITLLQKKSWGLLCLNYLFWVGESFTANLNHLLQLGVGLCFNRTPRLVLSQVLSTISNQLNTNSFSSLSSHLFQNPEEPWLKKFLTRCEKLIVNHLQNGEVQRQRTSNSPRNKRVYLELNCQIVCFAQHSFQRVL